MAQGSAAAALDLAELWTPLPTQAQVLQALADAPDMGMVAYVGAFGSGKTWLLCRAVLGVALEDPGAKILVGRFYATDLRDTTQAQFFDLLAEVEQRVRERLPRDGQFSLGEWSASRNEYTFSNGSLVMFRPLDQAEQKYRSLNASMIAVDEASEVPVAAMLLLKSRLRLAGHRRVGLVVSNPTPTRHWLYEWFVARPLPHHQLFRTRTAENHANLPPGYEEQLRQSYPADWVRVYLDGEWGALRTGQRPVFPTFQHSLHVQEAGPFPGKPVLIGLDWGFRAPAAVWAQLNTDGQLCVQRVWCPREIHTYQFIEGVRKRTDEWFPRCPVTAYAGSDGNKRHAASERTDAEIARAYGLPVRLLRARLERGLTIMRNLLDPREDGKPGLLIHPACERLVEGFAGGYYYEPVRGAATTSELVRVKEEPHEDEIHDPPMDALRYIVLGLYDATTAQPYRGVVYAYARGRAEELAPRQRVRVFA
ncbi:MAG: phage terminase large subunit [Armatimonadota bacterium]|nr:phage terminase large subunit [Armatimonadota bacterium]